MNGAGKITMTAGSSGKRLFTQLSFLMALLVALLSCSTHTPLQQQVINVQGKILDAYGGRARLAQIQSIAAVGSITAIVRGDNGVYRRVWRKDGKLFVDIQYTKSRETRILNGPRALRSVDGKLEEVSGPSSLAMVYQYNELSMPFALLDDSFDIENRGFELIDGADVRVLRCVDRVGNSLDIFVNETTNRIVKTTGTFSVEGKPVSLSSEYTNFQFIQGVLLPLKIVNYSGAMRISETIIDDYLLNPPANESLFDPHARSPRK